MRLQDGTGSGFEVKVDSNNQLRAKVTSVSQQHTVSERDKRAFQVDGLVNIAASSQEVLLIKNTSTTRDLVVTYIRLESIGAAAAGESAYFTLAVGGDYSSGGTAVTPVNMYVGSAITAEGDFYDGTGSAIVTSGTFSEIDRWYEANTQVSYNKEGSLVLPRNACLTVNHLGSDANGAAYARVSFYYEPAGD